MFFEDSFLDFEIVGGLVVIKAFFILFLIFYSIFALIIYRQVQLMIDTLPVGISPFLKFVTIIHIGVALALLLVVLGVF